QARVHARILSEEGRQALGAARVEQAIGPPLGNRPHLGGGHGEEIAGEADRRTVEVPARLDPSVGQDHRVVDRRSELRLGHPTGRSSPRSAVARASMPRIPSVPLTSARPSFAASVSGSIPAAASAWLVASRPPSGPNTSPSPISASAQWAKGARSPLAPSEP